MAQIRSISKSELYDLDFPWTIVDGSVYALPAIIPKHPGGSLIWRAVGEDASQLFHTHHTSSLARRVLEQCEVYRLEQQEGSLSAGDCAPARQLQSLLNQRICSRKLERTPATPVAEAVAVIMFALFCVWVALSYLYGWWVLNVSLAWFWQRHLDAGLHAVAHGDFRHSSRFQAIVRRTYSLLSYRALDYYIGSGLIRGVGMSKHLWHHVYTNDPERDPDWATMVDASWVRRHSSSPWQPHHQWQCWYWLPVTACVEPILELLQVAKEFLEAVSALLEPPCQASTYRHCLGHAFALCLSILLNPGFQGAALLVQPPLRALLVLLLSKAVARLVLWPFSEVQHYLSEHYVGRAREEGAEESREEAEEEWVVAQLRRTANLRFDNPLARLVDFLMFHGDSYQIEHHLWPAMSFVNYRQAAEIVRETCKECGFPYLEVSYWEGYKKIWQQVRDHTQKEVEVETPMPRSSPAGHLKRRREDEEDSSPERAASRPRAGPGDMD